ncbi:MAG: hypothetical protein PVF08_07990 [Gammaproteobacteria bacterium]|jgi:hypothetical protein
MVVIIKEWPDKTATIISANGQVIWTFSSTVAARRACEEWHNLVAMEPVVVLENSADRQDILPGVA